MKKILLAVALTLPLVANAGWGNSANASAGAVALAGGGQGGAGGNVGGIVVEGDNQRLQIPNAPSIGAASSNTTSAHRMLKSESFSFLFLAHSSTTMEFDLVSFIQSNPNSNVQWSACFQEQIYRDFREYVGQPCPPINKEQ